MAQSPSLLDIDGSVLEGGGQILRNSIAISALVRQPIRISKIRAGRDKPGLKAQHCASIELVRRVCSAECTGCAKDSQTVTFALPATTGPIPGGDFTENIGTAGSVCLMVQAALPVLSFAAAPSRVRIRGGTHVDFSPPAEHLSRTLAPLVGETMGLQFSLTVSRRGFFPKGGGEATFQVDPVPSGGSLRPVRLLEQGQVTRVSGLAFACGLPARVADEMASSARRRIASVYPGADLDISVDSATPGFGNGCGLALTARTSTGCVLGASALGRRGVPAHQVGVEAADRLLADLRSGACVDEHTQDQLVLLMALAEGESALRLGPLTLHTRTAIHVAEAMTNARFTVTDEPVQPQQGEGVSGGACVLVCRGVGFKRT